MKKRRDFFWPRETTVEHFWVVAKTLLSRNIHTGLKLKTRGPILVFTVLFWSHTYDPHFKSVGSSQKDKAAEKAQMLLKVFNNLQSIELERGGDGIDHRTC